MNPFACLSAPTNERVLWNLRKRANSIEAVLRRTSTALELWYRYDGRPGLTIEYRDAVPLVHDAEDYQAALLAAGWSARAVLPPRADRPYREAAGRL